MIKSILFSITILFAFSPVFSNEKCKEACDKFLQCAKEVHSGKSANASELKKMTDGCMNTCKKKNKEVMACYTSNANSCVNFAICIQKSYSSTAKN